MLKWEYGWATIPSNLKEIKVDGQKISVRDYFDSWGEKGWEMISIQRWIPDNQYSDWVVFFKRAYTTDQ
jgi:hypothetical protein